MKIVFEIDLGRQVSQAQALAEADEVIEHLAFGDWDHVSFLGVRYGDYED